MIVCAKTVSCKLAGGISNRVQATMGNSAIGIMVDCGAKVLVAPLTTMNMNVAAIVVIVAVIAQTVALCSSTTSQHGQHLRPTSSMELRSHGHLKPPVSYRAYLARAQSHTPAHLTTEVSGTMDVISFLTLPSAPPLESSPIAKRVSVIIQPMDLQRLLSERSSIMIPRSKSSASR